MVKVSIAKRALIVLLGAVFSMVFLKPGLTQSITIMSTIARNNSVTSAKNFTCPNNIAELTPLLLKDLPAYSNRVIQRTQDLNQAAGIESYLITANQAEFEPLKLPRLEYGQIDQRSRTDFLYSFGKTIF